MLCSLAELREKDVINMVSGENLGYADDVRVDTHSAVITGLILYGKPRYFGMFGAKERFVIPFERVKLIGRDVILVSLNDLSDMCNLTKETGGS